MQHYRTIDPSLDTTATFCCLPDRSSSFAIVNPFYIVLDSNSLLIDDIKGSFVSCVATVFRIAYFELICIG